MFYLYLAIFSLAESYLFRSINNMISGEPVIISDLLFSLACTLVAGFILTGALHVKHLNSEKLKKVGIACIVLGGIIAAFSLFTFKLQSILIGLESGFILGVIGCFVYYYQTVPEGEPDSENLEFSGEKKKKWLINRMVVRFIGHF